MRLFLHLTFFLLLSYALVAQDSKLNPEDFKISGDTRMTGQNCYQMTNPVNWSSGSIWHKKPIDLRAPFELELNVMLGCKDADGADGIVFTFHPKMQQTGYAGEGMGFAGLRPSLGIEIDTWENEHLLDPSYDHIAILKNGSINHAYNLAGPNRLPNLEDCQTHQLKVKWDPADQKMAVYIDGRGYIWFRKDIINKIFQGNPSVYWGVTAATGGYNNKHAICFEKLDYREAKPLEPLDYRLAQKLREGEAITLPSLQFDSGQSKVRPSSMAELDQLVQHMKKNPGMVLDIFGFTDSSGSRQANQSISLQRAQAVAKYLEDRGIPRKQLNPQGYGEAFPVAPNTTAAGRRLNRRIEFRLTRPIP